MDGSHPSVGRDYWWFSLVILAFIVVYIFSLTFVYVEGDDASSIAHHLLGRNFEIQPPYSPYHSMMDLLLRVFPQDETILRTAAISLTALAAPLLVILILTLTFEWFKWQKLPPKWLIATVILLAVPEFFYLGLVYLPSVIAMTLILTSHLILRRAVVNPVQTTSARISLMTVFSLILFGVGAACRWDITVYGGVIVLDIILCIRSRHNGLVKSLWPQITFGILWGVLALVVFVIAIAATGYSPITVLNSTREYDIYLRESTFRITDTIGAIQTLITPAFSLLFIVGFITLIRQRNPLIAVIILGVVLVIPWATRGVPKFILPCIPGLIACSVLGFKALWLNITPQRLQTFIRMGIISLLIIPWLIGIRIIYGDSAFGPGFEQRPYDRSDTQGLDMSLTLGAGALFPTSEGPRALWGHAAVLLGGGWRNITTNDQREITTITRRAITTNIPLLAAARSGYFTVALWKEGFITTDPRDASQNESGDSVVKRVFVSANGQSVTLFHIDIVAREVENLPALFPDTQSLIMYGYPRTLRRLYELAPEAMQELGNNSAMLDIPLLTRKIASVSSKD